MAQFYVSTAGSDTARPLHERADNPSAPFRTANAAIRALFASPTAGGGDTLVLVDGSRHSLIVPPSTRSGRFTIDCRPGTSVGAVQMGDSRGRSAPSDSRLHNVTLRGAQAHGPANWFFTNLTNFRFENTRSPRAQILLEGSADGVVWDPGCYAGQNGTAYDRPGVAINCRPSSDQSVYDGLEFYGWADRCYGDLLHLPGVVRPMEGLIVEGWLTRCLHSIEHSDAVQMAGSTVDAIFRNCWFVDETGKGVLLMPAQNQANDPGTGSGQSKGAGVHTRPLFERCAFVNCVDSIRIFNAPGARFRYNVVIPAPSRGRRANVDIRSMQPGAGGTVAGNKATQGTSIDEFRGNIIMGLSVGGDRGPNDPAQGGVVWNCTPEYNIVMQALPALSGDGYKPGPTDRIMHSEHEMRNLFVDLSYDLDSSRLPDLRLWDDSFPAGIYAKEPEVEQDDPLAQCQSRNRELEDEIANLREIIASNADDLAEFEELKGRVAEAVAVLAGNED